MQKIVNLQKQVEDSQEQLQRKQTELSLKTQQIASQQEGSKKDIDSFKEQETNKIKMINDLTAKVKHLANENIAVKEAMAADHARLELELKQRLE